MKIYTFFTDSHKIFLDYFVKSFPFEDGLDLVLKYLPQECADASYHKVGWEKTMARKVAYISEALNETPEGEYMVHSDVDICFFGKMKNDLINLIKASGKDLLFADDGLSCCMGFFIAKNCPEIRKLFATISENLSKFPDDQYAANHFISELKISYGLLPERYYGYGQHYKKGWNGRDTNFYIPNDILMFHANWVISVPCKIQIMDIVRKRRGVTG